MRAASLCLADDLYLTHVFDPHAKFKTHRNHTPQFEIKKCHKNIFIKQKAFYNTILKKPVPFKIVPHNRFNEENGNIFLLVTNPA